MDKNNYDRSEVSDCRGLYSAADGAIQCMDYFQAYRDCKAAWVSTFTYWSRFDTFSRLYSGARMIVEMDDPLISD